MLVLILLIYLKFSVGVATKAVLRMFELELKCFPDWLCCFMYLQKIYIYIFV